MQSIKSVDRKSNKNKKGKKDKNQEIKKFYNEHNETHDTSKIAAASALINDIEEKNTNKTTLTDSQKQTIQKILEKLFSSNILNKNNDCNGEESDIKAKKALDNAVNLKNIIFNKPALRLSDNEDDDDEDEYVEYVFKPRQYFLFSMCQFCKKDLKELALPCRKCFMTYYCSIKHMSEDTKHQYFCTALKALSEVQGGHIFHGTHSLSSENFRNFRVQMLKKCENILKRELQLFEKETILYPKICCEENCREYRYTHLTVCKKCNQIAFCKNNSNHIPKNHHEWCNSYFIMAKLIRLQLIYGDIIPDMPNNIIKNVLKCEMTMKNILDILYEDNKIEDDLSFANATQVSTAPLTAWYALKMFEIFDKTILNVHIVGAEFHFEANTLQKWEYFFLHLIPSLKELNIIFIGPELIIPGVSFDLLSKSRMCKSCRKEGRKVNFKFENSLYHEYYGSSSYIKPNLICFFNPGLYRFTGFNNTDTWSETIKVCATIKCPIIITSYTEYESPLDLKRFLSEAQRPIEIIMPPMRNPFSSTKPERNFISDEIVPLIFKNFYYFIVQ